MTCEREPEKPQVDAEPVPPFRKQKQGPPGLESDMAPGPGYRAEWGVRANILAPGPTWTVLDVADAHMPREGLAHVGSEASEGRPAQPEEGAPACVHLARDTEANHTTGEIIAVTRGLTDTR